MGVWLFMRPVGGIHGGPLSPSPDARISDHRLDVLVAFGFGWFEVSLPPLTRHRKGSVLYTEHSVLRVAGRTGDACATLDVMHASVTWLHSYVHRSSTSPE